ncbi:MAG: glycosyltransferase [Methylococcaceae bacterium]
MKISYIHGICVKNDAISNSIRDEITWLSSEVQNDVRLYTYACDHVDLPFTIVSDLRDVAFDLHFQSSDLVVFHFGVFYPLFHLLPVAPARAKRLIVFHNITPKQFVSDENHATIDKSFQQMANIVFADHVVCVSQTNLDVLRMAGIHTPATVLPLAVHSDLQMPESKPSAIDGLIRLAFVGRFVRPKGPGELLEALHRVLQRNQSMQLSLDMVGNLSFSDAVLLEEIRKTAGVMQQSFGDRVKIAIHGNASEITKRQILQDADLFVLPTYHEGFCVPIVEALASGCKVIAYENSNTPAIAGGLAKLTPTGDIDAMSCAIADSIEEITSSAWRSTDIGSYTEYARRTRQYVQQYSPELAKQRFLDFIKHFISS